MIQMAGIKAANNLLAPSPKLRRIIMEKLEAMDISEKVELLMKRNVVQSNKHKQAITIQIFALPSYIRSQNAKDSTETTKSKRSKHS